MSPSSNTSFPKDQIQVLLLEGIHAAAQALFSAEGYRVEALSQALPEADLKERLRDVHILGIRSKTQVTAEALSQARRLLTIGCFCIGTNQVDLESALSRGIPVFNAPFGNTRSVAEMVLGEIIMLARQLGNRTGEMHQGQWSKISKNCFEVRGKTLGIIGYGNIGTQISTLAEALGMRVFFYDILSKLPLGNAKACHTLAELLRESDFITLHVPATQLTHLMISEPQLKAMKRGAYLINASRGSVVDLDALAGALKSGHLAGAAIDVYPSEPDANSGGFKTPLQGIPNVVLTPHVGGATEEAQANIGEEVPTALMRFVNTGITRGAVNFPVIDLAPLKSAHRILNVHQNVPGVLREINRIVSDLGANIQAQALATEGDVGYLVIDTNQKLSNEVKAAIEALPTSIKTRILY